MLVGSSRRFRRLFGFTSNALMRSPWSQIASWSRWKHLQPSGLITGRLDLIPGWCLPRPSVIVGALFTLTALSFVTTYVFWVFVAENSATGTLESPTSYAQLKNHLVRGLRGTINIQDVQKELHKMFVIEPDTGYSRKLDDQEIVLQTVVQELEKSEEPTPQYVRTSGIALSCSHERPVCPEMDIPGLVGKRKVDLKDITISEAESRIFGPLVDEVRGLVQQANDALDKKLQTAYAANITSVDWLFDRLMESQAIGINNYSYLPGGHWKPMNCIPRWKVAIIIPYRDRAYHVPIILKYLIPMLQRQLLEFGFYLIEQANNDMFNRAMLMNVGYLESLNFSQWDCFIFHDVDHVPLDDRNYYGCSGMPRHFVSGADRWNYKLPYDAFFGAVSGLSGSQIRTINGFPNVYWGWGGEDDEIWNRVKEFGLQVSRRKGPIGHYDVIRHHHKSAPQMKERHSLLKTFKQRFRLDGLSDVVYPRPRYRYNPLYTNVSVDIRRIKPHYPMPKKGLSAEQQKALKAKMMNMTLGRKVIGHIAGGVKARAQAAQKRKVDPKRPALSPQPSKAGAKNSATNGTTDQSVEMPKSEQNNNNSTQVENKQEKEEVVVSTLDLKDNPS